MLKKLIQVVAVLLMAVAGASAQYFPYNDQVILNNHGLKAGSFSQVKICTNPACGTPLPSLFTGATGGATVNPLAADQNGNFHFFIAPGQYYVKTLGYSYWINIAGTGTGGGSLTNVTIAGSANITATGTCSSTTIVNCNLALPSTITSSTSGNAATATALAATPTQCGANVPATGITSTGAANCTTTPAVVSLTAGSVVTSPQFCIGTSCLTVWPTGGGGGVSLFSAGTLLPLFTTTVSNPATTPNLAFNISNAAQGSVLAGPPSGGPGPYSFQTAPTISAANMFSFPTLNQNTTGIAAFAAALSGSPTQCTGAQFALGITINGNANCGTPSGSGGPALDTNGTPNISQVLLNLSTSTTNSVGLTVTPVNPSGGVERFEITGGSYTGNAATATALASVPAQCTGTQFAQGIAADGDANCATPSGGGGSSPTISTNTVNNTSQSILDFHTSTVNSVGLTVTPHNPSGGIETMEITGSFTGSITGYAASIGNGTTVIDGSKAGLQSALNLCSSANPVVIIPPGVYTLGSGLTSSCPGIDIEGFGGAGDELSAGSPSTMAATTIIVVPSGQVGFTFNPSPSMTIFDGPTVRNVCFVGASGALGGIDLIRTNNFTLDHDCASYFTTGYGILSNGTNALNQYGVISNSTLVGNKYDIESIQNSGLRVINNHLDNAHNSGSPAANTKGIYNACPTVSGGFQNETSLYTNNVIVGSDILIDSECGQNDVFDNNRYEGFITAAVRLQKLNGNLAIGAQVKGGSINNNINGSIGVGIVVASTVANSEISNPSIQNVSSLYTDAGTNTKIDINGVLIRQTITATTQFTGPGTGLTGTAAALNIGGNAATSTTTGAFTTTPTGCGTNLYARLIAANGNLTCAAPLTANAGTINQFLTSVTAGGIFSSARPSAANLSDTATTGNYLRGNGTSFVSSAIQVADVPTLNQNTTGTAANGYLFKGQVTLTGTIGSGSSATTAVTVAGATTTTICTGSFSGAFIGITGFVPSTSGILGIGAYPTSGHCNFTVVNNTANPITMGSTVLNVVAF